MNVGMNKSKYRTLLSEVLPYETPLFFDNFGFYDKIVNGDIDMSWLKSSFPKINFSIPFNYNVKRNGGKSARCLSIIHPAQQLNIVDFYEKYDMLLVKNSVGSPFSLRHINDIAKLYYDCSHELIVDYDKTKLEIDEYNRDEKVYVSYFTYKDIDRMYKFFKDMPMFRLEQKYEKMRKLDVAKCFYHIYTHSITWAMEGKKYAKANKAKNRLSSEFDHLMQCCNYNETNGIVVGPEVSRIFAEIIFRRIDFRVLEKLKAEDVIFGRDYELRRYVDDMMIFANNDIVLDKIEIIIKDELEQYKLYVNGAKTVTYTRPFGTPLSCCKQHLIEICAELKDIIKQSKCPLYKNSLKFFRSFRTVASEHSLEYGELNRMVLSLLVNLVKRDDFEGDDSDAKLKSWLTVLDIAFYIFTLDMSVTASLHLCRIILQVDKAFREESAQMFTPIKEKLYSEAKRILNIHSNISEANLTPIEVINPLLAMKSFGINVCDNKDIKRLFLLEKGDTIDCSRLNYFNICSLLMLISDDTEFADIKNELSRTIEKKYSDYGDNTWTKESEMVLLFFDLMTCPFLDNTYKNNLIVNSHLCQNTSNTGFWRIKLQGNFRRWFFDWEMSPSALDYYLKKKEYRPTYE